MKGGMIPNLCWAPGWGGKLGKDILGQVRGVTKRSGLGVIGLSPRLGQRWGGRKGGKEWKHKGPVSYLILIVIVPLFYLFFSSWENWRRKEVKWQNDVTRLWLKKWHHSGSQVKGGWENGGSRGQGDQLKGKGWTCRAVGPERKGQRESFI